MKIKKITIVKKRCMSQLKYLLDIVVVGICLVFLQKQNWRIEGQLEETEEPSQKGSGAHKEETEEIHEKKASAVE